jgi:phage terminase large subunit
MKIPVESQIHLDKFKPRPYQLKILQAIENKGFKRVIAIMPRRAGKDVMAFNLCIRECLRKICVIYYIFPTYAQGRKALFDSIMTNGMRFLDFIPKELIASINQQEMKIKFINGSIFQVVGSDNYDALMGTNPQGVVFSEYALQDP